MNQQPKYHVESSDDGLDFDFFNENNNEEILELEEIEELSELFLTDNSQAESTEINFKEDMRKSAMMNEGIDVGGLSSNEEFDQTQSFVTPNEFNISTTLHPTTFDDYAILEETSVKFPYIVFEAKGNLNSLSSLCTGILKRGDVQLYFRPEHNNPSKLIPMISIATTPVNIRNLLRMSLKDSVRYRMDEESPERVVIPEQFVRSIDLNLKEDVEYWNSLIESEDTDTTTSIEDFNIEDLFDK